MDAVDHVVLGAGAVGMAIAEALARRGESVRVVNRSGLREPMAGIQSVTGDRLDARDRLAKPGAVDDAHRLTAAGQRLSNGHPTAPAPSTTWSTASITPPARGRA